MRILQSILLLSAFFLVPATSATATDETVAIGAEDAAGLWGMKDGTGCGNDIVLAAFKAADFPVTLQVLPYVRAKEEVIRGTLPGCFGMAWDASLQGKVVFADQPLYTVTAVAVERKDDTITKVEDLQAGMVVGTIRGYEYTTMDLNALRKRGVILEEANSETQNLQKLLSGRVRIALLDLDELKTLDSLIASSEALKAAGAAGKVKQAFVSAPFGTYVGFSTTNKSGLAAKQAFDKGYAIIKNDGTFDRILSEWKRKAISPTGK